MHEKCFPAARRTNNTNKPVLIASFTIGSGFSLIQASNFPRQALLCF